eukprot:TRINITY_DN10950_c0_g1_i1.p1 TRINITY_DN10950_c0_g1~~TRINITY_DN10950_c0_g1_i1.p1  ORF type:complete len:156 (+),score=30.58 TRINITY_DN10950_c0_g1_i1:72-470(+)
MSGLMARFFYIVGLLALAAGTRKEPPSSWRAWRPSYGNKDKQRSAPAPDAGYKQVVAEQTSAAVSAEPTKPAAPRCSRYSAKQQFMCICIGGAVTGAPCKCLEEETSAEIFQGRVVDSSVQHMPVKDCKPQK